jgi:hypothetical protein
MAGSIQHLKGKVRGQMIELDRNPGLPDGEDVAVTIERQSNGTAPRNPGDGIRAAIGAWAEDGDELDEFIAETYRARYQP